MDTKEIIETSIATVSAAGLDNRIASFVAEREHLLEPRYRVAFIGQFKTGKSTLINRLILKGDILFTDIMEATAIPVEISYAETPRLELYRYERKPVSGSETSGDYITGVFLDETIDRPSVEQIRQSTSGETPEDRAQRASTYSHAKLFWPAPNLRQFTVVDTTGINTPNTAVATTTYRILPECDLAIFVAPPKQLSAVDLQFLQRRVFEPGITRAMVVLHYDPRFTDRSPGNLQNIKGAVQASLANIGRASIPVTLAELAREGAPGQNALGQSLVESGDPLAGWPEGSAMTSSPVTDFETELVSFIQENIRPGKEEKIRARLRRQLEGALAECQVEMGLLEQDERTRMTTIETIRRTQKDSKKSRHDIRDDIISDLRQLQTSHLLHLFKGFDKIEEKFQLDVNACENLELVQNRLKSAKPILQMEVETLALDARKSITEEVRKLEGTYAVRLRDASQQWRDLDVALKIDGGFLERMPLLLVQVLDYALMVVLSPFPIFIDLFIRLLAEKIPGLGKLVPTNLAKALLQKWVISNASTQFALAKEEIKAKIAEAYAEAERKLTQEWNALAAEQEKTINNAADRSLHPSDPARIGILREVVQTIKRLLAQLPPASTLPPL